MRAVTAAIVLAGIVAAGESDVVVDVDGPAVEGVLLTSAPLKVETRYGALTIPLADLLAIEPGKGMALTQAGAVRGRLDWTQLLVRTRYGEARLPIKDARRVTWQRERRPSEAKHHLETDSMRLGGTVGPEEFEFATAYGTLRIPLSQVRFLAREEKGFRLRIADMTLRGEPRVVRWTVETAYGVLTVPGGDLVRLASRPLPVEGDRLDGGYVVRAVGTYGSSFYALVARDQQMTLPEAADIAKRMGGHLATVADDAENRFLCALSTRVATHAWIGFSDEGHEGDWRWVTNEGVGYTNWNSGEPNNAGGRENCCDFLVEAGGRWNDVDGGAKVPACLVEIDGS